MSGSCVAGPARLLLRWTCCTEREISGRRKPIIQKPVVHTVSYTPEEQDRAFTECCAHGMTGGGDSTGRTSTQSAPAMMEGEASKAYECDDSAQPRLVRRNSAPSLHDVMKRGSLAHRRSTARAGTPRLAKLTPLQECSRALTHSGSLEGSRIELLQACAPEHLRSAEVVQKYGGFHKVGMGATSIVYRAKRLDDGKQVVLKASRRRDSEMAELARRECDLLQSVDHPNIIAAIGFIKSPSCVALVLDFFEGVSLRVAVRSTPQGFLKELTSMQLFAQVVSALAHLHERTVVNDEPYTASGDIWSAGMCLHFMLRGRMLWRCSADLLLAVDDEDDEHPETGVALDASSSLKRCLVPDASKRASAAELLEGVRCWLAGQK